MTRSFASVASVGVAVVLLAAACGGSGDGTNVSAQEGEVSAFAESLAPCEGEVDGPDRNSILTMPGAWFRLSRAEALVAPDSSDPSTIVADAEYVGGDAGIEEAAKGTQGEGARFLATSTEAELVVEAVANRAETYIKVEAVGPQLWVILPVAFDNSDTFAFIGNCRAERYTVPLIEEYGARATEVVRALVGADVAETEEVLGINVPDPEPVIPEAAPLNPEFTDPEVLSQLAFADFILEPVPDSWIGP